MTLTLKNIDSSSAQDLFDYAAATAPGGLVFGSMGNEGRYAYGSTLTVTHHLQERTFEFQTNYHSDLEQFVDERYRDTYFNEVFAS